jgi:hypothetical protein
MEVDNKAVVPKWTPAHVQNACNSEAVVVDAKTIKFTWDPTSTDTAPSTTNMGGKVMPPAPKWGETKHFRSEADKQDY